MSHKSDEPAFPLTSAADHQYLGMSLRDYFAAKIVAAAISGGMANGAMLNREAINLAVSAGFIAADAMLAERAK